MKPFYAVIEDIYICLYDNKDDAVAYANSNNPCSDDGSIDDVYNAKTCNDYLKANNGYIAKIFEGHALC